MTDGDEEMAYGVNQVDMTSEGIDRRLTRVAQLLSLCRELAEVKRASDGERARAREEADRD